MPDEDATPPSASPESRTSAPARPWDLSATAGLIAVIAAGPVAGVGSMILSFATDGVAPDQYDSGNRAAGFFFAILISMLVSGVGAGVYGTVWCSWCRIRTAVLWGLVPAGVALAVVPILWNS